MATESTKSTNKTKTAKLAKPSVNALAEKWKSRCYGTAMVLLAVIVCLVLGGVWLYQNYRDNVVSDEKVAALEVFDEVAEGFVNGFDLKDGAKTHAEVTEYGVSPDGDFYIGYKLNVYDDQLNVTESKDGRVYFWADEQTGQRSFGFAYSE